MRTVAGNRATTLVIVLGASGRLGRTLLPRIVGDGRIVVGLCRARPEERPPNVHWHQVDLAEPRYAGLSAQTLAGMAELCQRVLVVDLVLDKASVQRMCSSIQAATDLALDLRNRVAEYHKPLSLLAASTTATLARWPYQTPYGLAKRRQLQQCAKAELPCAALLLPSLVTQPRTAGPRLEWSYDEAARRLAAELGTERGRQNLMTVVAPRMHHDRRSADKRLVRSSVATLPRLLVRRAFDGSDSPQVHRDASRTLLALTPPPLRTRVDHHCAPDRLVRILADRLGVQVERIAA